MTYFLPDMDPKERREVLRIEKPIPLLPRSGLYLWAHPEELVVPLVPRLAPVFTETWRTVPLWARRKMLGYWRSICNPYVEAPIPCVEIRETLCEAGSSGRLAEDVHGSTDGIAIRFKAAAIRLLPPDMLAILIAHELGHVYLRAIDRPHFSTPDEQAEEEMDVYEMILQWGFDEDALDNWRASNHPDAVELRRVSGHALTPHEMERA